MSDQDKTDSLKEQITNKAQEAEEKAAADDLKKAQNQPDQLLGKAEKKLYALRAAAKDKISEINK